MPKPGSMTEPSRHHRARGMALLLVLWGMTLLGVMGLAFGHATRLEVREVQAQTARWQAELIARAGVQRAILGLLDPDPATRWPADNRLQEVPWVDARLQVRVRSEAGKVNLNHAPLALLEALIALELPQADAAALAAAIVDWRDRDDNPLRRGAEGFQYRLAALDYGPANRPFRSVSELGAVLGWDAARVDVMAPLLTVHAGQRGINPDSAAAPVLAAIARLTPVAPSPRGPTGADRDGGAPTPPGTAAAPRTDAPPSYLFTESRPATLAIAARATLPQGIARTLEVVVRLRPGRPPFEILRWHMMAVPSLDGQAVEGAVDEPPA